MDLNKDQQAQEGQPPQNPDTVTVTFDTPIVRSDQTIASVTLRKPKAGALRGVAMVDLVHMEAGAVITVLPRISTPTLTKQDAERLDGADLVQCGLAIAGFLTPKALAAVSPQS
ncbi:phage tail assembly protein [Chitinimonas koreensis]|uniref:phage tail assembly protein n=1 Tax=Chitinimonas koreensis TaxID=356302 RepID=UPI0003F4F64B|nr:phage tail assembly protein [Chitinimonas koreensis]QNM96397.1 phage tail assembly protein [Chitinimonas koreensis]